MVGDLDLAGGLGELDGEGAIADEKFDELLVVQRRHGGGNSTRPPGATPNVTNDAGMTRGVPAPMPFPMPRKSRDSLDSPACLDAGRALSACDGGTLAAPFTQARSGAA